MKRPNFFKQYDSRWASLSWKGQTLRGHGCGPTSIANCVSVMAGHENITPKDTWKWICDHGFMTVGHGTVWDGMTKCLEHYGIKSKISTSKSEVKEALRANNFAIPLMGPGLWTRGGHFITAYYVDSNDNIYISDPASSAAARQKNKFNTFWSQEKRTWIIIDTEQYFSKDPSHPTGKERYSMYVFSDDGWAYIRKGRSTRYAAVDKVKNGKKLKLKNYSDGWYQIAAGKYRGYFISEQVLSKTKAIHKKYKVIAKGGLRVRAGYTKKAKMLKVLKKGTIVTAAKQRGRWVYVPSVKGWMCTESASGTMYLKEVK